jgi:hypothetical protein
MKWKELSPKGEIPTPRSAHTAVCVRRKHKMFMFGGCNKRDGCITRYFNDLYKIKFSMTIKAEW